MKRPNLKVRRYKHSKTHPFLLNLRPWGKGRMFFKTRAEADAERLRQLTALERHGGEAMALPHHELSDFIRARKTLAGYGKTINDATSFFVDHLERVRRCNTSVLQLADEVLEVKRKDGKASAYLADLRKRLARFCQDFGREPIAAVTTEQLDKWLRDLDCAPKTRANFRANIGVLFSHAERLGMIDRNPVLRTAKPKLIDNPPDIFTVDELHALLQEAQRTAPDVLPMLAIGAFTGLRDAEIRRLHWSEINVRRGFVEAKAAKAKSARRRIVPIQPNLTAWLAPSSAKKGMVVPVNARKKLEAVRKAAGLARWPVNGLRHSYASYRLAAIGDAPRVAHELGHTSPQMLYNTYREVVPPEEAERYWKIAPAAETKNVVAFANA